MFMAKEHEGDSLKVVGFDCQINVPQDVEPELKAAFHKFGEALGIPQVLVGDSEGEELIQ